MPEKIELTETEFTEFKSLVGEMKGGWATVKKLPDTVKNLETENTTLKGEINQVKRELLQMRTAPMLREVRKRGKVTTECAKYLGAVVLLAGAAQGKSVKEAAIGWSRKFVGVIIERGGQSEPHHELLGKYANIIRQNETAGTVVKDALTTADIPLPTIYTSEIVELVEEFGSFRRYAETFPLGASNVNLPKLTTDPEFSFIDMSESVPEKSPKIENVPFHPEKAGGMVRIPSELEEDSIVALGQFVARYIARQIASFEDKVGWLADGTNTYKTMQGVVKRVVANTKVATLGAGLTASQDVTLEGLRVIRSLIHEAAREVGAYYLHGSMESRLVTFNDDKNNPVYIPNGANGATLDGFPIRWVNKLPVNSSDAAVSTVIGVFGDMSFWYLGQRGTIRVDTDQSVFFASDQMAVRGLERFAVNEMATNHMAGLRTAAA
jgi:HK97 family phage major capsid protein